MLQLRKSLTGEYYVTNLKDEIEIYKDGEKVDASCLNFYESDIVDKMIDAFEDAQNNITDLYEYYKFDEFEVRRKIAVIDNCELTANSSAEMRAAFKDYIERRHFFQTSLPEALQNLGIEEVWGAEEMGLTYDEDLYEIAQKYGYFIYLLNEEEYLYIYVTQEYEDTNMFYIHKFKLINEEMLLKEKRRNQKIIVNQFEKPFRKASD